MAAATNGLPEDPALLRARLAEVEARYAQSQVQFRELRTWYDKLKRQHRELLWSEAVLAREGLEEAMPGPPIARRVPRHAAPRPVRAPDGGRGPRRPHDRDGRDRALTGPEFLYNMHISPDPVSSSIILSTLAESTPVVGALLPSIRCPGQRQRSRAIATPIS